MAGDLWGHLRKKISTGYGGFKKSVTGYMLFLAKKAQNRPFWVAQKNLKKFFYLSHIIPEGSVKKNQQVTGVLKNPSQVTCIYYIIRVSIRFPYNKEMHVTCDGFFKTPVTC